MLYVGIETNVNLIVATLDLQLVRLVRGAMGAADQKNIEALTQLQLAYPSALAGGYYAPQSQGHYLPPSGYGPPPHG